MHENDIESIKKAQNGDKNEMAKLVEDNQGLIWSIVKSMPVLPAILPKLQIP